MSNRPPAVEQNKTTPLQAIGKRLLHMVTHNWPMKLMCLGLSIVLWGGLISQDANLTREKTFQNISVSATNADVLQRNGLIVVDGLDDVPPLQMRVEVPQRNYGDALPSNYNARVDLSRITGPGEQRLPIVTTTTSTYGQVTWLSQSEVVVQVDDYVTRRRIPVQLNITSQAPAGFFGGTPTVDPSFVVISGPRAVVEDVARLAVNYDVSRLSAQAGTQLTAVPFYLESADGTPVDASQVTVTSESIILDTLMIEQVLYPLISVDINTQGILTGAPAEGYEVKEVRVSPAYLPVAGSQEFLKSLTSLNIIGTIDVTGATQNLVRAVRVEKPAQAAYLGDEAVFVTVDIGPVSGAEPAEIPQETQQP